MRGQAVCVLQNIPPGAESAVHLGLPRVPARSVRVPGKAMGLLRLFRAAPAPLRAFMRSASDPVSQYNAYAKVFSGSVQLWEAVKGGCCDVFRAGRPKQGAALALRAFLVAATKTCMLHGDPSISS